MAFRRRADDGLTLNAGFVALWFFRGSGSVSLRNPIFLWLFRGGPPDPAPSPSVSVQAYVCAYIWRALCRNVAHVCSNKRSVGFRADKITVSCYQRDDIAKPPYMRDMKLTCCRRHHSTNRAALSKWNNDVFVWATLDVKVAFVWYVLALCLPIITIAPHAWLVVWHKESTVIDTSTIVL